MLLTHSWYLNSLLYTDPTWWCTAVGVYDGLVWQFSIGIAALLIAQCYMRKSQYIAKSQMLYQLQYVHYRNDLEGMRSIVIEYLGNSNDYWHFII